VGGWVTALDMGYIMQEQHSAAGGRAAGLSVGGNRLP
jgi:hypothetical protein